MTAYPAKHPNLQRLSVVIGLAIAFAVLPVDAGACSCVASPNGSPPCESLWASDAVFVGRVLSVTTVPDLEADLRTPAWARFRHSVTFDVTDVFNGAVRSRTDVLTDTSSSSCGYPFDQGHEYLVHASLSSGGRLETDLCAGTRPIEQASEAVAYGRALAKQPSGGRILGYVQHWERSGPEDDEPFPRVGVPGIRATLVRGDESWNVLTNAAGEFEVAGLSPGTYNLRVESPPGFYHDIQPEKIELRNVRGCAAVTAELHYDGHVSGRVVSVDHEPIEAATVMLVDSSDLNDSGRRGDYRARTDEDGRFEISRVPPRRFGLRVDTGALSRDKGSPGMVFHPGVDDHKKATRIQLQGGEHVVLDNFVLPSTLRMVVIRGTAIDSSGTPASGVDVAMTRERADYPFIGMPAMTDDLGRFAMAAVEGERVVLTAQRLNNDGGVIDAVRLTVVARRELLPLELRLAPVR